MLHDYPSVSIGMQIPTVASIDTEDTEPQHNVNDDFDDVFGSEPSSPVLLPSAENTGLDDGSYARGGGNTEWSDIPRLKEKHETEGYRDGVTQGKAQTVQQGFDEGYGLGAVLGLRIGKILGLLEGIYAAVRSSGGVETAEEWAGETERLQALVESATGELKTAGVFGREYFAEDGIWKYEVEGERDGRDVTFPDVAGSHPLVRKWEELVAGEVRRWHLDLEILEHEKEEIEGEKVATAKEEVPERTAPGARKELNW